MQYPIKLLSEDLKGLKHEDKVLRKKIEISLKVKDDEDFIFYNEQLYFITIGITQLEEAIKKLKQND